MASSEEYLAYVMELVAGVPGVSVRKMMGEYLLYADGKVFGGVYDDRFLVKDTAASREMLGVEEIPYEGGKPMRLVDIEDPRAVAEMVALMLVELSEPRPKKR